MTDLDRLIEAVEAGNSEWDATFLDRAEDDAPLSLAVLGAWLGSLDAAKRLHDALLPGPHSDTFITLGFSGGAIIHGSTDGQRPDIEASLLGTNPARAWLLAILRALKAKGEAG